MGGDTPPGLSGSCGSYINGTFYVFAGCDRRRYTNEVRRRSGGGGRSRTPVTVSASVDVQMCPDGAELQVGEGDRRQGGHAIAPEPSLLLGSRRQVIRRRRWRGGFPSGLITASSAPSPQTDLLRRLRAQDPVPKHVVYQLHRGGNDLGERAATTTERRGSRTPRSRPGLNVFVPVDHWKRLVPVLGLEQRGRRF